jgi:hypothetical protein
MNQYLDAAIKAARAAGALVRENFGRPLKVNVEEAHDIKLELDVRSQALITDYQTGYPPAPINILKAEFDNLRALQLQIPHKPKNGEVRKGTAVRFDLSKGAGTIPVQIGTS